MKNKIEILAPAGDKSALVGAIYGGCDAVYLGTDIFNARIRATNFTLEEASGAIALAHAHQKKVYITLNTQLYEKELPTMLEYVAKLHNMGADAFIVADFGVASLIKKHYPEIEIHASTQSSVHNLDGANYLYNSLGEKRVVLARELDKKNIEYISKNTDAEIEIFVHGAHCMSVSGQCLFSYCMGGRSGNRGECAQPCRLPYKIGNKNGYPLSLKDMSLAKNMRELLTLGVDSLKIEGRMKGEEYVSGTAKIYRTLANENRNANDSEIKTLGALFSRQGFTDGYYQARIDNSMLGVRTDKDKEETSKLKNAPISLIKPSINMHCKLHIGQKASLTISQGDKEVTVLGDMVEGAINAPMSHADVEKSLSKLGNTPFSLGKLEITMDENIIVRVSSLNSLRRSAIEMLLSNKAHLDAATYEGTSLESPSKIKSAAFECAEQIPNNKDYFDVVFLPLNSYDKIANGVIMPPVIFDSEWDEVEKALKYAEEQGAKYVLATNIGQITKLKKYNFNLILDYRFNIFNKPCVEFLSKTGAKNLVISPELSLPQLRDFGGYMVIAYGKLPMLTTHKCVLKGNVSCQECRGYLTDRQGARLYVKGDSAHHRNIIYNSVPIYMADKLDELSKHSLHFIFSDETKEECYEIIEAYKKKKAPSGSFKRIK
jgi:putative protease